MIMPTYNFKTKRQRWELLKKVMTCMWTGKLKIVEVAKPEVGAAPFAATTMNSELQQFYEDRNQWGFPDSRPHTEADTITAADLDKIIKDLDNDIQTLQHNNSRIDRQR